jgi:hypothetical protein
MNANDHQARMLVDNVSRKLRSVSASDLMFPAIQVNRMIW